MIGFIQNIYSIISSFVSFFINLGKSLLALFLQIPEQLDFLTSSITALPPFVLPYATAFISINVILFILGRKSGNTSG